VSMSAKPKSKISQSEHAKRTTFDETLFFVLGLIVNVAMSIIVVDS